MDEWHLPLWIILTILIIDLCDRKHPDGSAIIHDFFEYSNGGIPPMLTTVFL